MKTITGWGISLLFFTLGVAIPAKAATAPTVDEWREPSQSAQLLQKQTERRQTTASEIVFKHGDISWLPELAAKAGWPKSTWKTLGHIILRESGGCPNRRGGDMVDKNCNITGVSEWNHRSDSGLLQINGVHWKPSHPQYHGLVCKEMGICRQKPLLDALTNLKAGKLLWDVAGFDPWGM